MGWVGAGADLGDDVVLEELGREVGDGTVGDGLQARQDGAARQRKAPHLAVEALRRAPALQPDAVCIAAPHPHSDSLRTSVSTGRLCWHLIDREHDAQANIDSASGKAGTPQWSNHSGDMLRLPLA